MVILQAGFEDGPIVRVEQLAYQCYDHSLELDLVVPDEIPSSTGVFTVCVLSEEYIGADVEQRIELRRIFEASTPAATGAGVPTPGNMYA